LGVGPADEEAAEGLEELHADLVVGRGRAVEDASDARLDLLR
jgi:hypothetical protein